MSEIKIFRLNAIDDLRNSIAAFISTSIDSASNINGRFQEILTIVGQLQVAKDNAYNSYQIALDNLSFCEAQVYYDEEGYECYADCSSEQNAASQAYSHYQRLCYCYDKAITLKLRAEDWKKAYDREANKFKHLAGNVSQESVNFLGQLVSYGNDYVALSRAYHDAGSSYNGILAKREGSSQQRSEPVKIKNTIEASRSSKQAVVKHGGHEYNLSTIETNSSNGNKFTQWSVANGSSASENFFSVKMSHQSKVGTLNDIKIGTGVFDTNSDVANGLGLLEKTAARAGCTQIESYIPKTQLSFFKSMNYEVKTDQDLNVVVIKNI